MENNKNKSVREYASQGTKDCQSNCNREVIQSKVGPVIVCHYCERIVRIVKN
jgi:hypothetical protein